MQPTRNFFKEITKASYMGTTNPSYLARIGVKVEPEIVNMHPADDVLRARWSSKAVINTQFAAVYAVLREIQFAGTATNPFFLEGKCPPSIQYDVVQASKVKRHYGVEGGLTNAAIASLANACSAQGIDNQIMNAEEQQLRILEIAFRNTEDWAIINGDSTADPLAFDGLAREVTAANGSLVVDLAGNDVTLADIEDVIGAQVLRGVKPTAIVSNPMMITHIAKLFYTGNITVDSQYNPYSPLRIPSVAGPIDLVPDKHVPVTYVSGSDYTTTVYILTEEHNGVPLLYMDYLIPETILPNDVFSNGTNCTSTTYGIYAVGTLVSRANVAQARLNNAGFNSSAGLSSIITSLSGTVI